MGLTRFPNGVSSFGIPVIPGCPFMPTAVFFVDDSGSDGNPGTMEQPFKTIDYAIGKCTSGVGTVILVMPGHAESTSAIALDVANVAIWGMGWGSSRPAVTVNAAADAISITAAGCMVGNMRFIAGLDAYTAFVNVAADGAVVKDCRFHMNATNINGVAAITVTADGDNCLIDNCHFYSDTVENVGGIVLEGAATNVEVSNCMFFDSIGFTNGCINDAATATGLWIHHNVFANAKANTVVAEFGNNSTGVCAYNCINGRNTTIASNWTISTGMAYFENYVVEEAQKSGLLLPAVDAE